MGTSFNFALGRPVTILIAQADPEEVSSVDLTFPSILKNFIIKVARNDSDIEKIICNNVPMEIDFIFLDADYQELDVIFLLQFFRYDERFENVPIIILSDMPDLKLEEKAKYNNAMIVSPKEKLSDMKLMLLQKIMNSSIHALEELYHRPSGMTDGRSGATQAYAP